MSLLSWALFLAVGTTAAAVHLGVVVLLVAQGLAAPLLANLAAWCVAFVISWAGHRLLTFRDQAAPLGRSARRHALVSLGGLAINESAYALLLGATALRYDIALALVLVGVAGVTYWLGRHWAFAGNRPGP